MGEEAERAVFVITAGMSIAGNLGRLRRSLDKIGEGDTDSQKMWVQFIDGLLSCIGPSDPFEQHDENAARRLLGLDPKGADPGNTDPGNTDPGNTDPGNTDPEGYEREFLGRLVGRRDRNEDRWLSAELSSLFADNAPPPQTGDHVILVTSDTDKGVRASSVVADIIALTVGGNVSHTRIGEVATDASPSCGSTANLPLVEPSDLPGIVAVPGVTVAVVGGLTADKKIAVEQSAEGIATVLGAAYAAARRAKGRLILHPIGGFKATIPVFTSLAAHLPTDECVDIEMWSNHAQTSFGLSEPLLRLGVSDAEHRDLQRIEAAANNQNLQLETEERWRGYAWEEDDGGVYRLTAVGRGILKLVQT